MSAPTPERFRDVMSAFATGVTVMTADDGTPHGMTASAVASVSLEPLLVLACVERTAPIAGAVAEAGGFALSLLSGDQQHLSEHFATTAGTPGPGQFEGIDHHRLTTGAPVLGDALAALDCRVWATYDGGDHVIVVGEVAELVTPQAAPEALVYFRSGYTAVAHDDVAHRAHGRSG